MKKAIGNVRCIQGVVLLLFVGLLGSGRLFAQAIFGLPEQQPASIEGRVMDNLRVALVADVMIYGKSVVDGRTDIYAMCSTKSDAEGRYQCRNLREGRYIVSATVSRIPDETQAKALNTVYPRTFAPSALSLEDAEVVALLPGEMGSADITMRPVRPGSISGNLASKPASPSFMVLSRLGTFELPTQARTQYDPQTGNFDLEELPVGDLSIYADWWVSGAMQHNVGTAHLTAGEQVSLTLVPVVKHKVSGVFHLPKDAATSASFPGSVSLVGIGKCAGWHQEAPIGSKGRFAFPEIGDGSYVLEMPRDSGLYIESIGDQQTSRIQLASDTTADSLKVALAKTATMVEGKVSSAEIVTGKTAVLFENLDSKDVSTTFPDGTGTFRMSGLPPGLYRIYGWADVTQAEYRNQTELMRKEKYSQKITLGYDSHITDVELSLIPAGS